MKLPSVPFPIKYAVALSLLMPVAWRAGLFDGAENAWFDRVFLAHGANLPKGDERLIVAAIDDAALKVWGLPPSRQMHVKLVEALTRLGAKHIAFDVMFFEKRPFDAELAAACKRHGKVIHLFTPEPQYQLPVQPIKGSAKLLAHPVVGNLLDGDGHLRQVQMYNAELEDPNTRRKGAPLLGAAIYAMIAGLSLDDVVQKFRDETDHSRPKDMTLRFRPPREWERKSEAAYGAEAAYRYIPIDDIIKGKLLPDEKKALRGATVVVASTALGYYDHYPTPYFRAAPGVEVHLVAADNALHDDFLRRVDALLVPLLIFAMIWLAVLLARLPPIVAPASALVVLALWYVGAQKAFIGGLWIDFMAPTTSFAFSFIGLTVHRVLTEGQEKRFIKSLFGQFVAPEVVEDLAKDPSKVKLGGEKKELTMFFLDIAHFTDISEKMPPEDLIVFLNKYLTELTHVVQTKHRGLVDKYIGDCVMAFWNAPMPNPDHRLSACLAAIECQRVIDELNSKLKPGEVPIVPAIRIGLNSGMATVGLTGSKQKLQYTVIGDEVNLASRLEGANKFFGSKIMASEATYDGAKDKIEARELGPVRVVGKQKPILVYELIAEKGKVTPQWREALDHYNMGIALFKQQKYDQAALSFQEVVKIFPDDGPATLYLNTSKDYSVLPPDKLPVVFNLTAK